jgi:hypothetical protein
MFQSAAVDVTISLVLMYLMLSLLCTVINEFIATKLKLRAKSLASALERLLDNQALRDSFYRHGLIVTNKRAAATGPQSTVSGVTSVARAVGKMFSGPAGPPPVALVPRPVAPPIAPLAPVASAPAPPAKQDHPSYLSSRNVALAIIGSLDPTKPVPGIGDIENAVKNLPTSHIRDALLSSLTEAGNDLDKLRTSIATWFDDSMERLSGAYKRQLKWISMLVGLIVTIAFNADSITVATILWKEQARRASAVAVATEMARGPAPTNTAGNIDETKLQDAVQKTEKALTSLPIGWNCVVDRPAPVTLGYRDCAKAKLRPIPILGWIVTAIALTFGAPFWFDMLGKFVNLRGAGARPKREDEKATA